MGGQICTKKGLDQINFLRKSDIPNTLKNIVSLSDSDISNFFLDFAISYSQSMYKFRLEQIVKVKEKFEGNKMKRWEQKGKVSSKLQYHISEILIMVKQIQNIVKETQSQVEQLNKKAKQFPEWKKHLQNICQNHLKKPIIGIELSDQSSLNRSYQRLSEKSGKQSTQNFQRFDERQDERKKSIRHSKIKKIIESGEEQISKNDKLELLETQLRIQESQNEKKNNKIKMLEENYIEVSNQCLQLNKQIVSLKKQIKEMSSMNIAGMNEKNRRIQNLLSQNGKLHEQKLKKSENNSLISRILGLSSVLFLQNVSDMYQKRQIITKMFDKRKITSTKLIFQYDPIHPNNILSYIKKSAKNLLFLCKLNNGYIAGGFSKKNYTAVPSGSENNEVFIFSINQMNKYKKLVLKSDKSWQEGVSLDDFYLRFGNNELRVTCQTNEGYSNIGCYGGCYFSEQGDEMNYQSFLGLNSVNFKIDKYQIHEIYFSEQE